MNKGLAERYLGLTGTYDQRALRKAYAREARRWHPDLQPQEHLRAEATRRMAIINESYAHLKAYFSRGAKTLTAESSGGSSYRGSASYGGASGYRGQSRGGHAGSPSHSSSTWTPPKPKPQPPVVVPKTPSGAPRAPEPAPEPDPEAAPPRHCLAYRVVEHFPFRIAFLAIIILLFISPEHAGLDYLQNFGGFHFILLYRGGFLDFLLWQCVLVPLAIVNLFNGFITDFIQLILLELIAWLERKVHGERTLS